MKTMLKTIAVTVMAAMLMMAGPTKTYADHNDAETLGQVFAGIAALGFFASILNHHETPLPPEPYCAPPPPPKHWVPGHYEIHREKVCIPGYWKKIVVPAKFRRLCTPRGWRRVLVRPARRKEIWIPERYVWQEDKVWVPGHYEPLQDYAKAY